MQHLPRITIWVSGYCSAQWPVSTFPLIAMTGRNPLESGDNVRRTDVAGVDNMRHACEALLDLRTQEPVTVRDDSNSTRPL
jgi:hypothetical protein